VGGGVGGVGYESCLEVGGLLGFSGCRAMCEEWGGGGVIMGGIVDRVDDLTDRLSGVVEEAYLRGLDRGLLKGVSRLEWLASVVPSSVTKQWILDQAGRQGRVLAAMMSGGDGVGRGGSS